jgi:acetylornithine deacetylase/succinyl-diaminopimelate desuccinylase-like protein
VGAPAHVLAALERRLERSVADLCALARIPGVSAPGFPPAEVERSARAVAALLEEAGLERVEVLRLPGAHPYVVAEWLRAGPSAPTVLVYAHHDVQPPGRLERWRTPPFEPTRRADGRLYGRGVVDDKAGLVLHVAALRAWLEAEGSPPLNVKLVVEGEEEIGSAHLGEFLRAQRERLCADVLVLSDTANLETGLPSLTASLRGLVGADVTVRALERPLHSGMWGGPVPDAATALARLLARLVDPRGVVAVPGLAADAPELSPAERARLAALPFDERRFREQAGFAGAALTGEAERPVYERLWARPAASVIGLEAMPLREASNQLLAEARARVSLRLAPGQDAARASRCLAEFLRADPPFGVEVEVELHTATAGWRTEPEGPAFDAARRALRLGYGREPVVIGCGGTIPFVGPFLEVLGGAPALLLGLEDPPCCAHGENESLDLEDFRKAALSAAHLLAELAEAPVGPRAQ